MPEPEPPRRPRPRWRAGPTTAIRVPAALAEQVLAHARALDQVWQPPAAPPADASTPEPQASATPARPKAPSAASATPAPPAARAATPAHAPPAWVRDAVFYQIFVDRFANGDRHSDPPRTKRWGSRPGHFDHFGGDLVGVRKKLPYLRELGVTALYLNPIFEAPSNHKYDAADYGRVDRHFGGDAAFAALLEACRQHGMRVILDGVFNHTGDRHAFFRDAVRRGPASPYWRWYGFQGYPVVQRPRPNYATWWGYAHLPKLNVAGNRAVQEHVFAVTEHWTRLGIDGWRLDVPTEIDSPAFWAEWRARVRAINPEAYLVGEIWEERPDWLAGRPFDALTNYPFRQALLDFFAHRRISVDAFDARLGAMRGQLGPVASGAAFNLLASHDVPRLMHEAGHDMARVAEAVFFQMVYPGTPVVYYGEELAMRGAKDPDNRRCMPWSKVKGHPLHAHYQRLIALRRAHPALRGPGLQTALRHNDYRLYAFWREGGGERLLVVLNSGTRPHGLRLAAGPFPDGATVVDLVGGRRFRVAGGALAIDHLPPHAGMVLGLEA